MAINASVDGVTYEGITKVTAGGKEINLMETGGALPSNVAEIKTGTYTPSSADTSNKELTHGCSDTPDIIIMWSNYKTYFTSENHPANTTIVAAGWNAPGDSKFYATVDVSYSGTNELSNVSGANRSSSNDGHIINVGSSTFEIKCVSNRRLGAGLTYTWVAIRLAS